MSEMGRLGTFWEIFKVLVIVFVSAIIIRGFVAQPFIVEGSSMEPDFHSGEYLLVEKLGYHFHRPNRGDVIVFRYPNNPEISYIKRIIGLPGETIQVYKNQVFANNTKLTEDYLSPKEITAISQNPDTPYEITLTDEQFFVMGDNRQHSSDSREWGPLDRKFIIGRSALVLYPRQNISAIASPNY